MRHFNEQIWRRWAGFVSPKADNLTGQRLAMPRVFTRGADERCAALSSPPCLFEKRKEGGAVHRVVRAAPMRLQKYLRIVEATIEEAFGGE